MSLDQIFAKGECEFRHPAAALRQRAVHRPVRWWPRLPVLGAIDIGPLVISITFFGVLGALGVLAEAFDSMAL
jgi:hypothetical protein